MSERFYDNLQGFSDLKYVNGVLYGRLNGGEYQVIPTEGNPGDDGTDGVNAYLYVAYASDDQGTAFSLIPAANLKYIALLQSTTSISSPTAPQFAGKWYKYLGDDGADGADGADGLDSYVYVAYASDAIGTAFNMTPSDSLKYRAEIHVSSPITSPSLSDFSGATWVKYIGNDGQNLVSSVNSKTGAVVLDAEDVGAEASGAVSTHNTANDAHSDLFGGKVDKVTGKGLSTEDYTTAEKTKLSGIAAGADVNVNADWNATSGDAQILNKPTIPDAQIQADWNQATDTAKDFIKNKPTIPTNSDFTLAGLSEKSYANLTDKPTIPSKTSDLTNDSDFTTSSAVSSGYVAKDGSKVLSDNNYDSASKSKLDNLANITSIGDNLTLTNGTLAGGAGASLPAGSIISFSGAIPSGFIELEADKTVSRSTYSTLFSAIGTKYGKGDGSTTFGLPDANLTLDKTTISNVLPVAKYSAPSTLLSDGRILVVAGYGSSGVIASCHIGTISGSEITWVETNALPVALYASTVATLSDGRVIVVGGGNASLNSVNTIYFGTVSGNTITWTLSASTYPSVIRQQGSLLLDDGRLACFGGYSTANSSAVYFGTISGTTVTWAAGTSIGSGWRDMRVVRISSDTFLIAGGLTTAAVATVSIGTISGNTITWTASTALPAARLAGACAIMKDGSVVYAGGCTTTTATSGTDTIYRGRVFKDKKKVIWELVGYLPDVIGYAGCVISSENNLIIAGLANASGASDTTIIIPISRQGIKT